MRSRSSAVIVILLLRIAYGSTEKELRPAETPPTLDRQRGECAQRDEYLRRVCVDLCRSGTDRDDSGIPRRLDAGPTDGSHVMESPAKRGAISKNSYLFMKLHPVLNRAVVDSNLMKVPTRYRRIGVRLGSEFLGKRNGLVEEEEGEEEVRRGRRIPGTELLGKRHGSEMLGKRNVEMLGKRGGEFLGKRSGEFLGKRGNEFLGKRGNEFLGKRGNEFLGKRSGEFLGKRGGEFLGKRSDELTMRTCGDGGGDCLTTEAKALLQQFKVAAGTEADDPEVECNGRSYPPDRRQPTQLDPFLFLEKL